MNIYTHSFIWHVLGARFWAHFENVKVDGGVGEEKFFL